MLYQMYLEEQGGKDTFEITKGFSLSHILAWAEVYEALKEDLGGSEVLALLNGESELKEVEDWTDPDFYIYSSVQDLNEQLGEEDHERISIAIERINKYHTGKQ